MFALGIVAIIGFAIVTLYNIFSFILTNEMDTDFKPLRYLLESMIMVLFLTPGIIYIILSLVG